MQQARGGQGHNVTDTPFRSASILEPAMTTVQITLPDALAQEAAQAGLLAPDKMERILRDRLRLERIDRMKAARDTLLAQPVEPMTPEEIGAEINAYRGEQRRAAGS